MGCHYHTSTFYFMPLHFGTNLHSKLVTANFPQTVPQERLIVSSAYQNTVIWNLTGVAEPVILTIISLHQFPNPDRWKDRKQANANDPPIVLTEEENSNSSEPSTKDAETNEKYVVRFVDCIQKILQYVGCWVDQVALCSVAGGGHERCADAGHLPQLMPVWYVLYVRWHMWLGNV
jgi:hypothetical protein